MNRAIFERAESVVVHSPWCLEQVQTLYPELADTVHVVPMGATPRRVTAEHRSATRARFGLPTDALLLGSFGILSQGKMNVEAIQAFHALRDELPPSTLLIFVGRDWENGEARDEAARLELDGRVRFLGRQDDEAFADLIATTDIGIALRRPPTYGETSAAPA